MPLDVPPLEGAAQLCGGEALSLGQWGWRPPNPLLQWPSLRAEGELVSSAVSHMANGPTSHSWTVPGEVQALGKLLYGVWSTSSIQNVLLAWSLPCSAPLD